MTSHANGSRAQCIIIDAQVLSGLLSGMTARFRGISGIASYAPSHMSLRVKETKKPVRTAGGKLQGHVIIIDHTSRRYPGKKSERLKIRAGKHSPSRDI